MTPFAVIDLIAGLLIDLLWQVVSLHQLQDYSDKGWGPIGGISPNETCAQIGERLGGPHE